MDYAKREATDSGASGGVIDSFEETQERQQWTTKTEILNNEEAQESIPPAHMYSLAGRYNNPIPTWFLAPMHCSEIPELALNSNINSGVSSGETDSPEET